MVGPSLSCDACSAAVSFSSTYLAMLERQPDAPTTESSCMWRAGPVRDVVRRVATTLSAVSAVRRELDVVAESSAAFSLG